MDEELKIQKKNLINYPMGTIGRDMIYQLFTNFILTFILFTRNLSDAQLVVITQIMVFARVFDAINDPIMGYIIEKTRTRWGKFKPWLAIGMIATGIVIITIFNSSLEEWEFVVEFGIIYFLYSITYTMHDISYWGMIPALSSDSDTRNKFTSRATLFAGIGGTLLSMLVPILTTGSGALGGNARSAYGIISIVVVILAEAFICFTIFGVKEANAAISKEEGGKSEGASLKKVVKTIIKNKQLLWIVIIFLIQQVGNGAIAGGIGSTYIYFTFGYAGSYYSIFSTIGVAATAFLMIFYPAISRKIKRKPLMGIMMIISTVGYALMLLFGLLIPNMTVKFIGVTIGYMASNFGQYCFYLIMMISILNTVEYNEYVSGNRDEAIIASVRPFITKMASALIVAFTSLTYLIFKVTSYTNEISKIEQKANQGFYDSFPDPTEAKNAAVASVLENINNSQKTGMLIVMVVVPFILMLISYFLYKKKYTLDEDEYDRICIELQQRKQQ